MEKFFLKRFKFSLESWQLGLLLITAIVAFIGFGALVEKGARDGEYRSGISKLAVEIARVPATGRRIAREIWTRYNTTLARDQRFDGWSGFKRFSELNDDETLLLTRYDGDSGRSVVEIIDLEDGAVLHRYEPKILDIINGAKLRIESPLLRKDNNPAHFTISHPILTEDGGIIFHGMNTPLTKIDVCSNIVWMIDRVFHHSLERGADGNYWSGAYRMPPAIEHMPPTWSEDTIVQVSPGGKILYEKSVAEILIENGLKHIIYGDDKFTEDPLHLNDVQPVLEDGPYWRRGDLFLSLRWRSAILLYRPSTDRLIWFRQGPWLMQHDVDIISNHEISVFDNNAAKLSWAESVLGVNNTLIFDFDTDETTAPFSDGFVKNDIRTVSEGLSEILPDGEIFVEETNYGRLLKMNKAGDISWQYVNRAGDGRNYVVNWSRYLDAALAEKTAALAKQKCASGE